MSIRVSNDELCTIREAMRRLSRMVEVLESGKQEKFVLAKSHRMRAVLISVDRYEWLRNQAENGSRP